ncbi:MAG: hypothetical protein J0L94_01145 [Rhodothermia bacterium]|nr:hypothetical protein [Rhodothermia bacterium]
MIERVNAIIAHLENAAKEAVNGEIRPMAVTAYGGELLNTDLITNPPRVFVELDRADFGGLDIGDGTLVGGEDYDLICVARNAQSGGAHYHAGIRLADWVVQAMRAFSYVNDDAVWEVSTISVERLAITQRLWIGVVNVQLRND